MKIKVNGKLESVEKNSLSVTEILKTLNVAQPDMVSVQLNGEFVTKDKYASTKIKDGDEVDFLYFMGGGQKP